MVSAVCQDNMSEKTHRVSLQCSTDHSAQVLLEGLSRLVLAYSGSKGLEIMIDMHIRGEQSINERRTHKHGYGGNRSEM